MCCIEKGVLYVYKVLARQLITLQHKGVLFLSIVGYLKKNNFIRTKSNYCEYKNVEI